MTNWQDTVMTGKQIDATMDRIEKMDTSYTSAEVELCRTQAELSFKAGTKEGVDWVRSNLISISLGYEDGMPYLHLQTNASAEKWLAKLSELSKAGYVTQDSVDQELQSWLDNNLPLESCIRSHIDKLNEEKVG